MADILIRGMEMPKNCNDCPVEVARYGECYCLIQTEEENLKARTIPELKRNCPLVPLPEKHGRLIDADALEYMELETCDTDDGFRIKDRVAGRNQIRNIVNSAPTIIEAEGGPDDGS